MSGATGYSFEVRCVPHESSLGAHTFTADAIIRDQAGKEVRRIVGRRHYSYAPAAEDEAIEAARTELNNLRKQAPDGTN